jgi:hypothetical protein
MSPKIKHATENDILTLEIVIAHHQPIMLFHQWSSILECQQDISIAMCASASLDEHVSESSGNEESSLGQEHCISNSSSNDSILVLVSGPSGIMYEMSKVSSLGPTSIIVTPIGVVAQVHHQMETGMEVINIQWGKECYFKT